LAWLVGAITGDGSLLVRKHEIINGKNAGKTTTYSFTYFYDQNPYIQQKFSNIVYSMFGVIPKLSERNHSNNPYKFGSLMDSVFFLRNSAISRTLLCCGIPEGEKVLKSFIVPKWILNTEYASDVKAKFLQGLMDSEGSIQRSSPTKISFSLWKSIEYSDCHFKFMTQIKELLSEFGIVTSKVYISKRQRIQRKDNIPTFELSLCIRRKESILNFYRFINFSNPYKNKILENHVEAIKNGMRTVRFKECH
jgi:intein/homing endonuclease